MSRFAPTHKRRPLVAVLPSSPVDGQECLYQTAGMLADGQVWWLRYNAASASAYKWEFVGGQGLYAEVITQQSTASQAFVDLATVGPSVTPPLAGDYMLEHGCRMECSSQNRCIAGIKFGAAGTTDNESVTTAQGNPNTQSQGAAASRKIRWNALAAATVLKQQYRVAIAATATFEHRWISATPIRVG